MAALRTGQAPPVPVAPLRQPDVDATGSELKLGGCLLEVTVVGAVVCCCVAFLLGAGLT